MNVLIVPCGTEIGMEIYRALFGVKNVEVVGLNSIEDASSLLFKHFHVGCPHVNDKNFVGYVADFIKRNNITHVFPAHDSASLALSGLDDVLNAKIITSSRKVNEICRSKKLTYSILTDVIKTPRVFNSIEEVTPTCIPVFVKPDVGQGSKGAFLVKDVNVLNSIDWQSNVVCEYLPGDEYTVDCFSSFDSQLKYAGARKRTRVQNGIAVGTCTIPDLNGEFFDFAKKICEVIPFVGAWFFQVKRNNDGELVILEVASRIAGSMSTNRVKGVNFPELSLYVHEKINIELLVNDFNVIQERNLANHYKLGITFSNVYVDFDDCLVINNKVNIQLVSFLFQSLNSGVKIFLITRHAEDITTSLSKYRLTELFDKVIHITDDRPKSLFIESDSIFIDDSFRERLDVSQNIGIPVFSVDAIESLLGGNE